MRIQNEPRRLVSIEDGRRQEILALMKNLPEVPVAEHDEVLVFVEAHRLAGSGVGWVDAHLLTAAAISNSAL